MTMRRRNGSFERSESQGFPGSSFFREPEHRFIRFHFAKKEETLKAAGERLLKLSDKAWLKQHLPSAQNAH